MTCKRCGQCCCSASFSMFNVRFDQDEKELGRWLDYHNCRIENIGGSLGVRIPIMCKHLIFDDRGIASCLIYETRPAICKEYFCQRAKD